MLVNYSLDSIESENAFNSVTLVPRLDYSVNLLAGIVEILQEKRIELKNLNEYLVTDFNENSISLSQQVEETVGEITSLINMNISLERI